MYYLAKVLNKDCIRQVYYAYVFPYIKYGVELYGTCNDSLMKKLQTEQNKLLKILYAKGMRYSTNLLYTELKLLKCLDVHKLFVGVFVYKQQNRSLPKIFDNYYRQNSDICARSTRQSNELYTPLFRTKMGQKSLKYIGAKIWNSVNEITRKCVSLTSFKKEYTSKLISFYVN